MSIENQRPFEEYQEGNIGDFNELHLHKRRGYFGPVFPYFSIIRATMAQSSVNFTTVFFRADRPYRVVGVTESHEFPAADGSLDFRKVPNGVAASSGISVLSASLPLTGAADTVQKGSLTPTIANLLINENEGVVLVASGTLVNLQGVTAGLLLESI